MTTYLLDTHYLIWTITDTKKISKKLTDILADPQNRVVVSVINFWEISLKFSLGKLKLNGFSPDEIPALCSKMDFDIIPLSQEESSSYHRLQATHHKDPFDHMLIWQAICNNFIFVSSDANVRQYAANGLRVYQGK